MAKKLTKRERLNAELETNLMHTIDAWFTESFVESRREHLGFISDRTAELMARAAMSVLEASGDVQEFMAREKIPTTTCNRRKPGTRYDDNEFGMG